MGWRGVSKAEESGGGDLAGALASRTVHLWIPRCSQQAGKEVPGILNPEPEVPSEETTRRGSSPFSASALPSGN